MGFKTIQMRGKRRRGLPELPNGLPELPQEIIFEIIARLPVKSLLRFKCVRQSWRSQISDPRFVKKHLHLATLDEYHTHHRLLIRTSSTFRSCLLCSVLDKPLNKATELDHPFKNTHRRVSIIGSCNGLVCLSNKETSIILWNPSTREFKRLPELGIDKSSCSSLYGFGYDCSIDDYKVVALCSSAPSKLRTKVYTLRPNSWRWIHDFPCEYEPCAFPEFVSGALNWLAKDCKLSPMTDCIVNLDLATEKYGNMALPLVPKYDFSVWTLGVLKGCLCSIFCTNQRPLVDVWVMKEYGVAESWIKLLTMSALWVVGGIPIYKPLCMSTSDEILVMVNSYRLDVYNQQDKRYRTLLVNYPPTGPMANIYVESLVSLNAQDGI